MDRLLLTYVLSISSLLFGQTDPHFVDKVVVENVEITKDSFVSSENLRQLQQDITKQEYRENAQDEIADFARYELQKRGYFEADVNALSVQSLSETPDQRTVAVTLRINQGHQYRLAQIDFRNNKAFASSQLRQAFPINDDDVLDTEKLRLGLEQLRKLYASQGYIDCTPVPNTEANEAAQAIALVVDIDEGKRFKIESLILSGNWPEGDSETLTSIFRPYAGGLNFADLIDKFRGAVLASDGIYVGQNAERDTANVYVVRPTSR